VPYELRSCIPVKVHILPATYKVVELIAIKKKGGDDPPLSFIIV